MRTLALALVLAAPAFSEELYRKPPKEILEVLDAPVNPQLLISPTHDYGLLAGPRRYPPIAEVARPMLRLAGLRINPQTNGPHLSSTVVSLTLVRLPDGAQTPLTLPPNPRLSSPEWSPDGKHFVFTNTTAGTIELWLGDTTGKLRRLRAGGINAAMGDPLAWMPDSRTLLVQLVPDGRGQAPEAPPAPRGPNVQETSGRSGPVRTFQDMLRTPHDEALFAYYTTSQLALIDIASGQAAPVGRPAIFRSAEPSPDGKMFLVARIQQPYSYLHPAFSFPREVEVWDRSGKTVHKLASLPLADRVPIDGVPTGPRNYHWRPTEPATLVWAEALDGGNPKEKVPHRDRVLVAKAPFGQPPAELLKTEHRFQFLRWGEKDGVALAGDFDRARRWQRIFALNADRPAEPPRLLWSLSAREQYKDPGQPVLRTLAGGQRVIHQQGDWIFLSGPGATPVGDRPFLDRFNLKTLQSERLFRSDANAYESFVGLLDDAGASFVTTRQSPTEPPNYQVRSAAGSPTPLTRFPDPAPRLRGIHKQLVTYKRADGVPLSFTLYLPPGYQKGARLPTLVWAYPLEYSDADTAGQVSAAPNRFTIFGGASHLFALLAGYAVLDNATMPVVGDPDTMNNTYVEQIVASAKAAIDKAVELGVTDAARVAVSGHSYGGFMTANLLAHSDLFRAGVARSGAYNRTLTPFGFQAESRTFWEAPEIYIKMSPFVHAHKINEPILLIHGEADNNMGTHPIQSERLYQALRGHGATARLVMLPHEAHGYAARESIEHVVAETIAWLDKYVKNAGPVPATSSSGPR